MIKAFAGLAMMLALVSCNQNGIDNPEITIEELNQHISFLASDSLKGRRPGTTEGKIAAEYIANELISYGFKAFGDKPYQDFEVITEVTASEENSLKFGGVEAILSEEYVPLSYSANSSHEGSVVFCGYGFDIETEDIRWNDFNMDLNGKWAMILLGDPEPNNPDSKFIPYANGKNKVISAKDHGAAGVIFISGIEFDRKDELTGLEIDQTNTNLGIPVFHIKRELANQIIAESEKNIIGLEQTLNTQMKPATFSCNTIVSGNSKVINKKVNTQNVVVWIEGNDPELKNEYILMGGHYDHLGFGGKYTSSRKPDTIAVHYGADDNASGIASLIEAGEYLGSIKDSLKRSIIIVAFGAEEIGILGSKHLTANSPVEIGEISAMINVDMIGRLKESKDLLIGGVGSSVEGEDMLNEIVGERDLNLSFSYNGLGPSDHAAFYIEDIPVFFFSTGAHEDYHTPEDVIEKINFEGLKTISEYVTDFAVTLINNEKSLTFQEAGPKVNENTSRRSKVKLGIMPNFGKSDTKGLRIDGITPGGSADLAGMEKGDIIVAIEGKPVENIYEYMARMGNLKPGMTITVDIVRNELKEVVIVQLSNQ